MSLMHKRTARHPFNLIEVTLALGVVGIGMVSIMCLFPIGLNASRDSVAEGYAADSADQFLHWYAVIAKQNWNLIRGGAATEKIPDDKPYLPSGSLPGSGFEDWTGATDLDMAATVRRSKLASEDGVYRMRVYKGNVGSQLLEFDGVYRIWSDPVQTWRYNATLSVWEAVPLNEDTEALAVNLEVSWPSELPYTRRQKAMFRIELFKTN